MFPNLLPIVLVMGFVGLLSIPLNLNTLMIGCIALGLVVDDTMHFMHNFRRHHEEGRDACEAIRCTLLGTGRAIFITSVVLFCVFLMALAASLKTLNQFGLFTAIIIILALLADFALAPALMLIISEKRR
jgi:predicted RND superfamily exporter protein